MIKPFFSDSQLCRAAGKLCAALETPIPYNLLLVSERFKVKRSEKISEHAVAINAKRASGAVDGQGLPAFSTVTGNGTVDFNKFFRDMPQAYMETAVNQYNARFRK